MALMVRPVIMPATKAIKANAAPIPSPIPNGVPIKALPPRAYRRNPARIVDPEAAAIQVLNLRLFVMWATNFCPDSPVEPTAGPTKKVMIKVPPTQNTPPTI